MAQNIERLSTATGTTSQQSQVISLVAQKSSSARLALATANPSPSAALKLAERLVGQWPHAKPPNMSGWLTALASVLAQYPAPIAGECVDPRVGVARGREFPPTVACVVEWCDERRRHYERRTTLIAPRVERDIPILPEIREQVGQLFTEFAAYFRAQVDGAKPEDAA